MSWPWRSTSRGWRWPSGAVCMLSCRPSSTPLQPIESQEAAANQRAASTLALVTGGPRGKWDLRGFHWTKRGIVRCRAHMHYPIFLPQDCQTWGADSGREGDCWLYLPGRPLIQSPRGGSSPSCAKCWANLALFCPLASFSWHMCWVHCLKLDISCIEKDSKLKCTSLHGCRSGKNEGRDVSALFQHSSQLGILGFWLFSLMTQVVWGRENQCCVCWTRGYLGPDVYRGYSIVFHRKRLSGIWFQR